MGRVLTTGSCWLLAGVIAAGCSESSRSQGPQTQAEGGQLPSVRSGSSSLTPQGASAVNESQQSEDHSAEDPSADLAPVVNVQTSLGGNGNNGLGNGLDPAAPGAPRENDGFGTGPGSGGNRNGCPSVTDGSYKGLRRPERFPEPFGHEAALGTRSREEHCSHGRDAKDKEVASARVRKETAN